MRQEYTMNSSQMPTWNKICEEFAKKINAELIFVNETSCGIQYSNGIVEHVYIDEVKDFLESNA